MAPSNYSEEFKRDGGIIRKVHVVRGRRCLTMTKECSTQGKRHSNARAHSSKRVKQIMEADNVKSSRPTYDGPTVPAVRIQPGRDSAFVVPP